jgi:hypothetical protein
VSLKTWVAEFYPVDTKDVPMDEAVAHSLKKWEGLSKKNMKKHSVWKVDQKITDRACHSLSISDITCALCVHFKEDFCLGCPLKRHLGQVCCGMSDNPYGAWLYDADPWPMIRALRATLKKEQNLCGSR